MTLIVRLDFAIVDPDSVSPSLEVMPQNRVVRIHADEKSSRRFLWFVSRKDIIVPIDNELAAGRKRRPEPATALCARALIRASAGRPRCWRKDS